MPTETVYGLAANALNEEAVLKIFLAKKRPQDNPLIVHIAAYDDLKPLVKEIPQKAGILAKNFWPGPLTMVFKRSELIKKSVSTGLDTVAVRVPSSAAALEIIRLSGLPLAAPSANLSGSPSPTSAQHVISDLMGEIDAIVMGEPCKFGVESTVLDMTCEPPCLLRPGGISVEEIEQIIGKIEIAPSVLHELSKNDTAKAPGMKYKHYSPKAEVTVIDSNAVLFESFAKDNALDDTALICFDDDLCANMKNVFLYGKSSDHNTQAQRLFSLLRELDSKGYKKIIIHAPEPKGIGLAVYNRLLKACGNHITKLPMIIGITGTTGSGKSEVSDFLSKKYAVISADKCAKEVTDGLINELADAFGQDIINTDKTLNRKLLAQKAFASKEKTELLNSITHPPITKMIDKKISALNKKGIYKVFLDAPQLFEANMQSCCQSIIGIIANDKARLARIIKRDNLTKEQALLRMGAQKNNEFFSHNCDIIIENNKDINTLYKKLQSL